MLASVIYHVGDPTALTPLATIVDTLLGVLWYFSGATKIKLLVKLDLGPSTSI